MTCEAIQVLRKEEVVIECCVNMHQAVDMHCLIKGKPYTELSSSTSQLWHIPYLPMITSLVLYEQP